VGCTVHFNNNNNNNNNNNLDLRNVKPTRNLMELMWDWNSKIWKIIQNCINYVLANNNFFK